MIDHNINEYLATADISVVQAMEMIDKNAKGILFIVDEEGALTGSLTDGDIRRWIIKTGDLCATAKNLMNTNVRYLFEADSENAEAVLEKNKISSIPVLDNRKKPVDIVFAGEKNRVARITDSLKGIPCVIMAGGKGTRLYPFTKILPKPLIPIGDIPIIERIMNRFNSYGITEFYITVNYKKEMIRSYFNELNPPYEIHYVEEDKPLGTAGSIKLIKKKFDSPVIITNCDILIEADYDKILKYHKEQANDLTLVSSLKNITIPYGVLHSKEDGIITSMEEKPQLSYFINTGMYIVNPEYIEEIPDDTFFHMTDLSEKLMKMDKKVAMYPISENSYLDMGQFEEMKKMEERVKSGEIK